MKKALICAAFYFFNAHTMKLTLPPEQVQTVQAAIISYMKSNGNGSPHLLWALEAMPIMAEEKVHKVSVVFRSTRYIYDFKTKKVREKEVKY